jgi:hypothetical protein
MKSIPYTFSTLIVICIISTNFTLAQNSYYFDSKNGNDTNDGLSENSAWNSHSKIESVKLLPGDVVYFKRGSAWVGGIQIDVSGSEGNPIVFTNYGSGELPKFSNPNWSDKTGNALRFNGDYLVADGLCFHDVPPLWRNIDNLLSLVPHPLCSIKSLESHTFRGPHASISQ